MTLEHARGKGDPMENTQGSLWETIEHWASRSGLLFLKKLSRNDTSWATDSGKHQAGFYVPRKIRESGFFPDLIAREDKPHIFHAVCPTFWPQTGEIKNSGMRHYSNKGPETHFTVIPHDLFRDLSPASWLLGGRLHETFSGTRYWFVVIDSITEDAEILETTLDIDSGFHHSIIEPEKLLAARAMSKDEAAELIEQIQHAIRNGTLGEFISAVSRLPPPSELAEEAQRAYLSTNGISRLNPYEIERPGDAVMRISRDFEYQIFKRHELKRRAAEVIGALTGNDDLVTSVVRGFPALDAIFLSASQQRKTRAGRSFENHLATLLRSGNIRFEEQAVLGGRRPDFVLPSKKVLGRKNRDYFDSALLSAKTTLRERWKQITHERFNCAIFLATVDDRVSTQALNDMQASEIVLVVPESLKTSDDTFYKGHGNVISFRQFFDEEIRSKRPTLMSVASTTGQWPPTGQLL